MRARNLVGLVVAALLSPLSMPARADCTAECSAAYHGCRDNPDTCLGRQGVCLARCRLDAVRHGAIAYSRRQEVYGYSDNFASETEANAVAERNCRKESPGADDCEALVTFHNA